MSHDALDFVTPQEVAESVLRRRGIPSSQPLCSLLWSPAVFSLLLLPCDYRAGAGFPHPHSLLQLWIDAADGTIQHDHADGVEYQRESLQDVVDHVHDNPAAHHRAGDRHSDVGEQQPSAPVVSGLHVLTAAISLLPELAGTQRPPAAPSHPLVGRAPRVLDPPPR